MPEVFNGVQLSPQSVFDEGPEHCLDFLREHGAVNAVCVNTHVYNGGGERSNLSADHGVPPVRSDRPLARTFLPTDESCYAGTSVRLGPQDPGRYDLGGVDVLAELIGPAHDRGMKIYARHLEGFHHWTPRMHPNIIKVCQVDAAGRRTEKPCWNHPEYRVYWLSYVEDVVRNYAVDGLYLGSERDAPLGAMLHDGDVPVCFCEHCRAQGRAEGVDPERARQGMDALHRLMRQPGRPRDGTFVSMLRLWITCPEILGWQRLQHQAKASLFAELYGAAKVLRSDLEVGWHFPYYPLMHDLFARACWDYAEMADTCDFLKLSVYFDAAAGRFHRNLDKLGRYLWRDLTRQQIHDLTYAFMGFDPDLEPGLEQTRQGHMSADYVRREVARCVEAFAGRSKVYAGLGIDVPHPAGTVIDPQRIHEAVRAAFEAGADGLLLSREYHFMRRESLGAVKHALSELGLLHEGGGA